MSILALWRKQKKKKRKIPNQRVGKSKKERKFSNKDHQRSEENKRNMQKGLWTRQYLNNTELSPIKQKKKGKHDLKWSTPFDCQPKSCALATFSPHTKQKQKRKRPKTLKANFPTKKTNHSQEKSHWSMIMHVIFDLIGNDFQNQVMTYLWFGIRMKHLHVRDWYTLSEFLLFLLNPMFPLNDHLEVKF